MSEEKNSLGRALLGLLKVVLYIALLLLGFLICFFGIMMFAWISGLHNTKKDTIALVVITIMIEGVGALIFYLARRLIGKGKSASNAVTQVNSGANN
jgi:hypothetical protein